MNLKIVFLRILDRVSVYVQYMTYLEALILVRDASLESKKGIAIFGTNVDLEFKEL